MLHKDTIFKTFEVFILKNKICKFFSGNKNAFLYLQIKSMISKTASLFYSGKGLPKKGMSLTSKLLASKLEDINTKIIKNGKRMLKIIKGP
jgi:hypothetical protein